MTIPVAIAVNGFDALVQRALEELATWSPWLEGEGATGTVGEPGASVTGSPHDVDSWTRLLDDYCSDPERHGIGATAWAAGRAWGSDRPLVVNGEARPAGPIAHSTPGAVVLEGHRATAASPHGGLPVGLLACFRTGPVWVHAAMAWLL